MRLEEHSLPPFISYINARLTGRPLHTAIWLISMLLIIASIYKLNVHRSGRGDIIMVIAFLYAFVVAVALISVAARTEGRRWLLEKYEDGESRSASSGSRTVVRLLPLLGLIVIAEYLLLR